MIDLKNARCVVLGGGGFLGTNLCRALRGRVGHLRAFGRRQSFPEALQGVQWMQGDFSDPSSIAAAITGCDVVFHLISTTTPATANIDKVADLQANVVGTVRLLEACRAANIARIVFVSSGGTIYGIPEQVPTPESAPASPISAYGVSKLAIEKYLALYDYSYGLDYRALRVANPFGPFQVALKSQGVIAAFMRQAADGNPIEIWGDGSVVRDYIYVDDVTDAMIAACTHEGASRIFNIGSGEGRSLLQIVESIEAVSGRPVALRFKPGRPIDIPRSILDNRLAGRELGWSPRTPYMQGIRQAWDWMREHGG